MNGICIVSRDKVFARMLYLELSSAFPTLKAITEKLNSPALKLAVEDSELIIFDGDYFNGDLTFVKKNNHQFVVFSKSQISPLPENVAAFFERPFAVAEFTERVLSLATSADSKSDVFSLSDTADRLLSIELDPFLKQATVDNEKIRFSPKEFALLSLLFKNRGNVVARQSVIDTLWGEDYDPSNNVDNVYINYLRKKLDDRFGIKLIYTVRGKGYMMK